MVSDVHCVHAVQCNIVFKINASNSTALNNGKQYALAHYVKEFQIFAKKFVRRHCKCKINNEKICDVPEENQYIE